MDHRKQLVRADGDANLPARNLKMSFSGESSLGRRAGVGLFEPGNGLPATKEIHTLWLHAGTAATDQHGAIISINDELASWLGRKPADLINHGLGEALAERDKECAHKFVEIWQTGGAFTQMEVAGASRSKREWFSMEVVRTGNGGFFRIASQLPPLYELGESAWDAFLGSDSSRRNMYVRLLRAEAQLDNWVNRWPGVMFSQRADYSFIFASSAIEHLTGIPPEEWRKQPQRFLLGGG